MTDPLRTPETPEDEVVVNRMCPYCNYNDQDTIFKPHNILEKNNDHYILKCFRCSESWARTRKDKLEKEVN